MSENPAGTAPENTVLGHPRGLVMLFFAEMWERFSYYGMRALLIFYLTEHFLFSDQISAGIFASYAALVYLTPIFGGYVADRWLGYRKAVVWGGLLIMLGHICMAVEGAPAQPMADGMVVRDEIALQIMYFALALIIVGTGLLKANISAIVGSLYGDNDPRRDGGYTLFYMGINVGAFLAPIVCGYLGHTYGWAWGFGAAAVGMAAGLVTFVGLQGWLDGKGEPADPERLAQRTPLGISRETLVVGFTFASVVLFWMLVQQTVLVGGLLGIVGALLTLAVAVYVSITLQKVERDRIFALLVLMPVSVLFWAFFEQTGSSIALFAKRGVDLSLFGLTISPAQIQSINPLFIIFLAPLFGFLWSYLGKRNQDPSLPSKFGLAMLQMGAGFGMFVLGIALAAEGQKVAFIWLVLGYLLHTTGELCLSPVGLSGVSKLSVPRLLGLMMGVWFLSNAFANYMAGLIAMTAAVDRVPGEEATVADSLPIYAATFEAVALLGAGAGILVLVLSPLIRKLMHGVR